MDGTLFPNASGGGADSPPTTNPLTTLLSADEYKKCFRSALRRMAVALNCSTQLCPKAWLDLDDDSITAQFDERHNLSGKTYYNLLVELREEQADSEADYDDEDRAEHFFYGDFLFELRDNPRRIRTTFRVTETFITWSCEGFHKPDYKAVDLGIDESNVYDPKFLASCATNYLLKNFWHNYVHNVLQEINYSNYRSFEGDARYEADVEADNLANLFLIHSYGLPVTTSINLPGDRRLKITELLRRNRCNKVFYLRDKYRGRDLQPETNEEDWREFEWQYCRRLTNYVSGFMAVDGRAVISIGVYLTGEINQKEGKFCRDGTVVVELNGVRCATEYQPMILGRGGQREHFFDIAHTASAAYGKSFDKSSALRTYSNETLAALFNRAGLVLRDADEGAAQFEERPTGILVHKLRRE
jgi:hypothetical protein